MMPRPPAFDTAEASRARAIQPIGACTMGYSTPSISVTRVLIMDKLRKQDAISSGDMRIVKIPIPDTKFHLFCKTAPYTARVCACSNT